MSDDLKPEILPCPFCDSTEVREKENGGLFFVECIGQDCSATGPEEWTPGAAIAAWNTRAKSDTIWAHEARIAELTAALKWMCEEYENEVEGDAAYKHAHKALEAKP
jgi:Restriction alleviation protein Lar